MAEKATVRVPAGQAARGAAVPGARLVSLDAYRGFIMLLMACAGFGIPKVASHFQAGFWTKLASQLEHSPWVGCTCWDLIQPAFMFMVGVALPYSYARRQQQGDRPRKLLRHAVVRAVVLVLLGIFLASASARQTNFIFTNVLAQIGLGYVFAFLLWDRGLLVQLLAACGILAGYWGLFYWYPAPQPGPGFDYAAFGLPKDWPLLTDLAAHWNKNTNFAAWFDQWFLNLFPRDETFRFAAQGGGYQTLNFVPSVATMIFGLMCGQLLRSPRSPRVKFALLVLAGGLLMAAGLGSGLTVCPIVKRIWTPSWALFSGAWVVWILAAFYGLIDLCGYRRWAFPLVVVGMNSIVMYLMSQLMRGWTFSMLKIHFGPLVSSRPVAATLEFLLGPKVFDPLYLPIVQSVSVLVVFWLICWWLYRQKLFVRI